MRTLSQGRAPKLAGFPKGQVSLWAGLPGGGTSEMSWGATRTPEGSPGGGAPGGQGLHVGGALRGGAESHLRGLLCSPSDCCVALR